jgi:hypothetical protein
MSNKKETAVEYLVEQLIPKALSVEQHYHIIKAKEMESKKQQKYDEMLAMLEELINLHELGHEIGQYDKAKQLIKEAKEL